MDLNQSFRSVRRKVRLHLLSKSSGNAIECYSNERRLRHLKNQSRNVSVPCLYIMGLQSSPVSFFSLHLDRNLQSRHLFNVNHATSEIRNLANMDFQLSKEISRKKDFRMSELISTETFPH